MSADEPSEIGNWVKQRVLGSGGFGVVTLWKHKIHNQMIALKKCRWGTDQILSPKHKERWSKEVEIMQRLSHPNVVQAVSVPDELTAVLQSELPMLCMEFCAKGDLRQVLNRAENCCGLPEHEVRAIVSDISSAVRYLHSMKITHRDLKPENIVLQQDAQRIMYKLIDLGYAKELDQSSICTSFVGTLQYLAPELFMSKTYTCSVDYWSLGLVSHEVITGVRPFLPNMPPVSWMNHVSGKSSDDISAYQGADGSIVFCKELFPQNQISSCLKYYMERWLKICLEWDPKKRGRDVIKTSDGEIAVFNMIDNILNKTIIMVYDLVNYQALSYEIDNSTAVGTLQRWIERDTNLSVENQELLLADGTSVDLGKEAWQCLTLQNSLLEPHVYVYRRGVLIIPEVTPQIPSSVTAMMQDPRNHLDYTQQIRAYAHAVFFLNQEQNLNKLFRHAIMVKLVQLSNRCHLLSQDIELLVSELYQVHAQQQLNEDAQQFDQQEALNSTLVPADVVKKWKSGSEVIRRQLNKLKDVTHHIKLKCDSTLHKARELGANCYMTTMDHETLHVLVDAGKKCYELLRRRPKDKRSQKADSVEMVKIVYNCLKTRDKLLRDPNLNTYLQRIVSALADVDKLYKPLHSCAETVRRVKTDLAKVFRERQLDIWTHFNQVKQQTANKSANAVSPNNNTPNINTSSNNTPIVAKTPPPMNLPLAPSPVEPVYSPVEPVYSPQPSPYPVKTSLQQPNSFQQTLEDTNEMIYDNIALRYATQDLMNESFQRYCSILSEDRSFDWTFLKN